MNFRTQIDIPHSKQELSYNDSFLLLGSCFSDHIAQKLTEHVFNVVSNPFGTLYNPLSIAKMIEVCTSNKPQVSSVTHENLYHSFLHHGRFSHADKDIFEQNIAESIQIGQQALHNTTTIIITFGTAWVYERNGEVVSNCHKLPEKEFTRRRLTVEDIVSIWKPIVEIFTAQDKRLIFTVSPIRHKRDGFHENQLSKSTLLLAIEELVQSSSLLTYFPSYEIVLDELRDYRFFAEDMLHPSTVAINYVWQRFSQTYFSHTTQQQMAIHLKEYKYTQHHPLH